MAKSSCSVSEYHYWDLLNLMQRSQFSYYLASLHLSLKPLARTAAYGGLGEACGAKLASLAFKDDETFSVNFNHCVTVMQNIKEMFLFSRCSSSSPLLVRL